MWRFSFFEKVILLLLLICNVICFISCSYVSMLNIDEFNSVNYGIEISNVPLPKTVGPPSGSIAMVSKFGQQYYCTLPEFSLDETSEPGKEDALPEVTSLLEEMKLMPCLTHTNGWWTYEVCFGKHVRQYHNDENTGAITSESILGLYRSEFDWSKADEESDHRKDRYHSQYYQNGTKCDLTGAQRDTEVRYVCRQDAADRLISVMEPEICRYRLIVSTSRLCRHPWLRSHDSPKVEAVRCAPVLESTVYQDYQIVKKLEEDREKRAQELEVLRATLAKNSARRDLWRLRHLNAGRTFRQRRIRQSLRQLQLEKPIRGKGVPNEEGFGEMDMNTERLWKLYLKQAKKKFTSRNPKDVSDEFESELEQLDLDTVKKATKNAEYIRSALSSQFKEVFDEAHSEVYKDKKDNTDNTFSQTTDEMSLIVDKLLDQIKAKQEELSQEAKSDVSYVDKEDVQDPGFSPDANNPPSDKQQETLTPDYTNIDPPQKDTTSPPTEETLTTNNKLGIVDETLATDGDEASGSRPDNIKESLDAASLNKVDNEAPNEGVTGNSPNDQYQQSELIDSSSKSSESSGKLSLVSAAKKANQARVLTKMLQEKVRSKLGTKGEKTLKIRFITARSSEDARRQITAANQEEAINGGSNKILGVVFLNGDDDTEEVEKQNKMEEGYNFSWPPPK